MVEFFAILISCFALVLILFCSQHGYIFLAGAGSATPDEVKSGRHTEYRLIKYGISTLCQEKTRIIKRVDLAECRYPPANKTLLLPFFLYCCSVSGSREEQSSSRCLPDIYNRDELHVTRWISICVFVWKRWDSVFRIKTTTNQAMILILNTCGLWCRTKIRLC